MRYEIFEGNMERLKQKLAHIANKCHNLGCDFVFDEVGEEFRLVKNEYGIGETLRYIVVEVDGVAKLGGWKFIASVEHTPHGNIINRADCGIDIPDRFYTSSPICDHCNTNRARKDTFLVVNEATGEIKQVGKTCLADFTGGLSASSIAGYYSYFDEIAKSTSVDNGGAHSSYYNKVEMLSFIAETIKHFGFVKKTAGEDGAIPTYPTASRAFDYYKVVHMELMAPNTREILEQEMSEVCFNQKSDETNAEVRSSLDWLAMQDDANNYIRNLKTICASEYITSKHIGMLASLIPTWRRETAKEQESTAQGIGGGESQYVGQIGDRLEINITSIACVASWVTDWGTTRIYKIFDGAGNVFAWKTSKFLDIVSSKPSVIIGTVKNQTEYKGIKQTGLTRCKII